MSIELRELSAKWRKEARPHLNASGDEAEWAACRARCANELDAVIAALVARPAHLGEALASFLGAIIEEHGANDHAWLTRCALDLRQSLGAQEARPASEEGLFIEGYMAGVLSAEEAWAQRKLLKAEPPAERPQASEEQLRRVIGNCYMAAKRGLSFGRQATPQTPERMIERRDEALNAIVRFCESAGERSTLLRWQVPTEITEGEAERPAASSGAGPQEPR